jgi:hypothetical protein
MIGEIHRHAVCQHQALKGIFWPMRAALVERIKRACRSGEVRPRSRANTARPGTAGPASTSFSAASRADRPDGHGRSPVN